MHYPRPCFPRLHTSKRHRRPGVEVEASALRARTDEKIRRGAYHRRIVRAILELGIIYLRSVLSAPLVKACAQALVRAHAARDRDLF